MRSNERGMAGFVELLLIAVVLGAFGFVGYRVMKNKETKTATNQQSSQAAQEEAQSWQKGDFAVKGKFADADILKINDTTWRMYYSIQPEVAGNNLEVYSATSTDGKTWKEESGTRKTMATFPDVVKLKDGRYRMYYQNASVIKSAISSDGLAFTDESGTRIDKSNSESLTFDNVAAPTVMLRDDGTFMMVYRGTINTRYATNTPNATTQVLMWATSSDGLTFTQKGLAVDSRTETLAGQLDGPDLVAWDDDEIKVFATSYTGVYEFDFENDKFSAGSLAFAGEATKDNMGYKGAPPGDPTLAKISDVWYMYYGDTGENSGIHYATLE